MARYNHRAIPADAPAPQDICAACGSSITSPVHRPDGTSHPDYTWEDATIAHDSPDDDTWEAGRYSHRPGYRHI